MMSHDLVGEPLAKNKMKNLKKDWEKQSKLFESGKAKEAAAAA